MGSSVDSKRRVERQRRQRVVRYVEGDEGWKSEEIVRKRIQCIVGEIEEGQRRQVCETVRQS